MQALLQNSMSHKKNLYSGSNVGIKLFIFSSGCTDERKQGFHGTKLSSVKKICFLQKYLGDLEFVELTLSANIRRDFFTINLGITSTPL